jgi:hypothetical protein
LLLKIRKNQLVLPRRTKRAKGALDLKIQLKLPGDDDSLSKKGGVLRRQLVEERMEVALQ